MDVFQIFQDPWLLAGLAALPVLWWLLRHRPPRPSHVNFPATWIVARIRQREETPTTTPWWMLLVRGLLLSLVVFGLSRPLIDNTRPAPDAGPLVLLVDNDWSTAPDWKARMAVAKALIDDAEQRGVGVAILPAEPAMGTDDLRLSASLMTADAARERLSTIVPEPWAAQRSTLLKALSRITLPQDAEVHWLWNGVGDDATGQIAARLAKGHSLTIQGTAPGALPYVISGVEMHGDTLSISAGRLEAGTEATANLKLTDADGNAVGNERLLFGKGDTKAHVDLRLPPEELGRIANAEIIGSASAASTYAFGDDWRRRRVGLVSDSEINDAVPLTSPLYYLKRALAPQTALASGTLDDLLDKSDVLILTDRTLSQADIAKLKDWIQGGGLVIRFAGDKIAAHPDVLTPMGLRRGGRELGAAMTWDKPVPLGKFGDASPFAGLTVPKDVTVARQVLADPNTLEGAQVWARLQDGTPLVTARNMGDGILVMFQVGAEPSYSTLAYSGLFVEMLQRVIKLSGRQRAVTDTAAGSMAPTKVMDGHGALMAAPAGLPGISAANWEKAVPSPLTPPGLYEGARGGRALNLAGRADLAAAPKSVDWPPGTRLQPLGQTTRLDLLPPFLIAALLFLGLDLLLSFRRRLRPAGGLATAALALILLLPYVSHAQSAIQRRPMTPEQYATIAAADTHLAYVISHNAAADRLTEEGLETLTRMLTERTSVEPAEPMAVDLDKDEISFFPVVYWAVSAPWPKLSPTAIDKLQRYMRTGGLLVIDTGDGAPLRLSGGEPVKRDGPPVTLADFVAQFATVPLAPIASDHVLGRSFYLLSNFPGRWAGHTLYVSADSNGTSQKPGSNGASVSPMIVTSNGWAAGWALGSNGEPLVPIIPGGAMQQEHAWRTGINMMMYALTGTYKADQVHLPALLERLGQ